MNCVNITSGGNCTATCSETHVAGQDGPPTATCAYGDWGQAAGNCVAKGKEVDWNEPGCC
jgi:hypothetical protein